MAVNETDVSETILDVDVGKGDPMAVVVKSPQDAADAPTIVVFHDAPGIRDATHVFSRKLARSGYRVVIPDLYHREGRLLGFGPAEAKSDPTVKDRVKALLTTLTDEGIQSDLDASLEAIDDPPDAMACLGFCLGARAVFRTMMRLSERFVAGAAWHPSFLVDDGDDSPHLLAGSLPGSLYLGFGEADTIMTLESMEPFIAAVSGRPGKTVIEVHPGANHGFTWPDAPSYDHNAAETSFRQTDDLFNEALG